MDASFEWDPLKEIGNLFEHGVDFAEAQLAFLDPCRVIATDKGHSHSEERWYCFGRVGDAVLTVRFTYRNGRIRIIGAGYWSRGRKFYEANAKVHE